MKHLKDFDSLVNENNEAEGLDKPIKGLGVYVYRSGDTDSSMGGISSKYDRLILVGEGIPEIFEVKEGEPYLELERRNIGGREYLSANPKRQEQRGKIGGMFGGNFVHTSDSRFPSDYPIPVHDRFETQQEYDGLSK